MLERTEHQELTRCRRAGQDAAVLRDFVLFRLLVATFAGWVNQNLQVQLDYLLEESRA